MLPAIFNIGCSGGGGDKQQPNPAMMQTLASQQSSGNTLCSADTAPNGCAAKCQQWYASNPNMLNSCLNSNTGKQGKVTANGDIVATTDLIQSCDDNGVCVFFPVGHLKE